MRTQLACVVLALASPSLAGAQRYTAADGRLRVALAQQPFLPNGTSSGPATMANGVKVSTVSLMKRYGMPQSSDIAANSTQPRVLTATSWRKPRTSAPDTACRVPPTPCGG